MSEKNITVKSLLPIIELFVPMLLGLQLALEVLVAPLKEAGRRFFLAEFVVDGDECFQHWNGGFSMKLVLFVMQGLGIGPTFHRLIAE